MIFIQSKLIKGKKFERFQPFNPFMWILAFILTIIGNFVILFEYGKLENYLKLYRSWFEYDDVTFM